VTEIPAAIVALVAGLFIVVGATVSGQQEALCKAMGGTYAPTGADICPGGSWATLIGARPAPR
jgi:hypothetical protein